jgi:hypothetical protein
VDPPEADFEGTNGEPGTGWVAPVLLARGTKLDANRSGARPFGMSGMRWEGGDGEVMLAVVDEMSLLDERLDVVSA